MSKLTIRLNSNSLGPVLPREMLKDLKEKVFGGKPLNSLPPAGSRRRHGRGRMVRGRYSWWGSILISLILLSILTEAQAKEVSKTDLQKFIYDVVYDGGKQPPARYNKPIRVRILGDGSWMRGPEIENIVNKIAKSSQIDMSFTRESDANFYIVLVNKLDEEITNRYWSLMKSFINSGETKYTFIGITGNCYGRMDLGDYRTGQTEIIKSVLFVSDVDNNLNCFPLSFLGNLGFNKVKHYTYYNTCDKFHIALKYLYKLKFSTYQYVPMNPKYIDLDLVQPVKEVICGE